MVFITPSRQSHIVRNDVTMLYFKNVWRTISIVACVQPPLTSNFAPFRFFWGEGRLYRGYFDSNGWTFKGQGTVGNWTRCCVLVSDFKFVIFFPGALVLSASFLRSSCSPCLFPSSQTILMSPYYAISLELVFLFYWTSILRTFKITLYFVKGFKDRDRRPLSRPPLGYILARLFVTPTFKSVN